MEVPSALTRTICPSTPLPTNSSPGVKPPALVRAVAIFTSLDSPEIEENWTCSSSSTRSKLLGLPPE